MMRVKMEIQIIITLCLLIIFQPATGVKMQSVKIDTRATVKFQFPHSRKTTIHTVTFQHLHDSKTTTQQNAQTIFMCFKNGFCKNMLKNQTTYTNIATTDTTLSFDIPRVERNQAGEYCLETKSNNKNEMECVLVVLKGERIQSVKIDTRASVKFQFPHNSETTRQQHNVTFQHPHDSKTTTQQVGQTVLTIIMCINRVCVNMFDNQITNIALTDTTLSFDIPRVKNNQAGEYCLVTESHNEMECVLVVLEDKPQIHLVTPTTSPVLQVTPSSRPQGKIILNCSVTSTSKPDDHNLTMIYRWFIDGVFTRSTSPILDVDLTPEQREITCIATDYPACGQILNNIDQNTDLKTVKDSPGCKDVLSVSSPLNIIPEYGPYKIYIDPSGSEIKKKLSEKLKVKCDVKCNPPCDVHWLKDDVDVDDDDKYDSILYIDQLNVDDDGKYTCTATNIHGFLKTSFSLHLTDIKEDNETLEGVNIPGDEVDVEMILSISIGVLLIILIIIIAAFVLYRLNKGFQKKKKKRKRDKRVRYVEEDAETGTFIELKHDKPLKSVRFTYQPKTEGDQTEKKDLKVAYADLDLKPSTNNIVHGNQNNRVVYTQIDFTKIPPPRPCGTLDSDYQTDSD